MNVKVRPRVLNQRLTLMGLGAIMAAAVVSLVSMPAAKADPVADYADKNAAEICLMLDHQPTLAGVDYVVGELLRHNLAPEPAAAVLLTAVNEVCPYYLPVVFAWANQSVQPSISTVYQA